MKNEIDSVIEADLAVLKRLAHELKPPAASATVQIRFEEMSAVLAAHLAAMNRVVHPALALAGVEVDAELLQGQARLTHAFAEALTLKPGTAPFGAALAELLKALRRMVALENSRLLPLLSQRLDYPQKLAMGFEAQRYVSPSSEYGRLDSRLPAGDWMEEARLILGGLAMPRRGAAP